VLFKVSRKLAGFSTLCENSVNPDTAEKFCQTFENHTLTLIIQPSYNPPVVLSTRKHIDYTTAFRRVDQSATWISACWFVGELPFETVTDSNTSIYFVYEWNTQL